MTALVGFAVTIASTGCGPADASADEIAAFRSLRGTLATVRTSDARPRGRYIEERVRLENSTGLVATGLLLHPASSADRCLPAMLLEDGREEMSGVINRLPPEFGDMVVLSLDYPTELPDNPQIRDVTLHATAVRRGARVAPALFSLGAGYLAQRPDVDSARVALVAASYAVPFGTIAAAMDERVRNVALIYGAGSLPQVFAANLKGVPSVLTRPLATLAMMPFAPFTPERYVRLIAPRPLVMINGVDDSRMPLLGGAHAVRRGARPEGAHSAPDRTSHADRQRADPVAHRYSDGETSGAAGRRERGVSIKRQRRQLPAITRQRPDEDLITDRRTNR